MSASMWTVGWSPSPAGASARSTRPRNPSKAKPLTLGRSIGGKTVFFGGDLDEVHVFEGPLLPGQVNRLMKSNTARAPKKPPVNSLEE